MIGSLQQYLSLYQFPAGRLIYAMHLVLERAQTRGLDDVVTLAQAARVQGQETVRLERAWDRSRSKSQGRRVAAAEVDAHVDRTLGGLANQLAGFVHTFGDEPEGVAALAVQERIFPLGAAAITTLSYENELAAAEQILSDLEGEYAGPVETLALGSFVDRLRRLLPTFRDALARETEREVSFSEVREARAMSQDALVRVVATVIAHHPGDDEADTQARQQLLGPVMSQNRRIQASLANRRGRARDVDPETGEELIDDDAPLTEADGAAGSEELVEPQEGAPSEEEEGAL